MGWGISRVESRRREADGKDAPKPAPTASLWTHRALVGRLQPAPGMQAGRRGPGLAFFRPQVPRRSAPGFRFPPPPPAPLRPARPSYSRPSSLQSGPPRLGTAQGPPWPRPGWRPSGPRRPAQAEGLRSPGVKLGL